MPVVKKYWFPVELGAMNADKLASTEFCIPATVLQPTAVQFSGVLQYKIEHIFRTHHFSVVRETLELITHASYLGLKNRTAELFGRCCWWPVLPTGPMLMLDVRPIYPIGTWGEREPFIHFNRG